MGEKVQIPPHAYLPGISARHPEGAFDTIRDTVRPGMTAAELGETAAFRHGLSYLEAGYFWEAHEVLEPVWMACPPNSARRLFVQALIQCANAALKARMGRPQASSRLCRISRRLLEAAERLEGDRIMGCRTEDLRRRIDSLEQEADSAV